jgi:hypothetical protein
VFHGYDANDNGKPKLRIEKLDWINGWPVVARQRNNWDVYSKDWNVLWKNKTAGVFN